MHMFSNSSVTNTGTIEIGGGRTLEFVGLQGSGIAFTQAGTISGPGTLDLEGTDANFVNDFSNAETSLISVNAILNGPGTLHFVRDQTVENNTINAAIINDAILTLNGANINDPFTANPGSTLRVLFDASFATAFTNHGIIEVTSDFGSFFTVSDGTLVNAPDGVIRTLTGSGVSVPLIGVPIDNQGLIEVEEAGLTTNKDLTTSGTVRISAGQTLTVSRLEIAAGGVVSADGPGTLEVTGLGSQSQDPNTLANLAVIPIGSQFFHDITFEAMSEDRGPVSAGFDSNFALRQLATISIPFGIQGGDIKLVDNVDNSPGTAPEAVYADSVVLVPVTHLDLNGLHLYTRAASIAPSHVVISNGTIQIVGDGGPIDLNKFEPGNIGAVDERDQWTFTGRAGQTVTVVVKTGGSDADAPSAPQIGFAQLELSGCLRSFARLGDEHHRRRGRGAPQHRAARRRRVQRLRLERTGPRRDQRQLSDRRFRCDGAQRAGRVSSAVPRSDRERVRGGPVDILRRRGSEHPPRRARPGESLDPVRPARTERAACSNR